MASDSIYDPIIRVVRHWLDWRSRANLPRTGFPGVNSIYTMMRYGPGGCAVHRVPHAPESEDPQAEYIDELMVDLPPRYRTLLVLMYRPDPLPSEAVADSLHVSITKMKELRTAAFNFLLAGMMRRPEVFPEIDFQGFSDLL